MLEKVIELTSQYVDNMPKKERKKYGQFFTSMETARFMAGLYDIPTRKRVTVLDAGAGSGILSCAFIEHMEQFNNVEDKRIDAGQFYRNKFHACAGCRKHTGNGQKTDEDERFVGGELQFDIGGILWVD